MSTKPICTSCLRALRQTARRPIRSAQSLRLLSTTPVRADYTVNPPRAEAQPDASTMQKFAQRMRAQKQMLAATEPYVAYGSTQELFRICGRPGEYTMPKVENEEDKKVLETGEEIGVGEGWWYNELSLLPTFNTWAQITMLHMYLLTVRLRQFPAAHAPIWHQNMTDHFFYAAEDRMVTQHNIPVRSLRNRYLKDLFVQWRGLMTGYDEGLIKGDAVMAAAVWRNLFGAREDVDPVQVAEVVSWMRKSLRYLERLTAQEIAAAEVKFPDPAREGAVVGRESAGIKAPIKEDAVKVPAGITAR